MKVKSDKGWATVNEAGEIQYWFMDRAYGHQAVAKWFAKRELRVGDTLHRLQLVAKVLK